MTFNENVRTASTEQRFKYNGKEEQKETGWIDFGGRDYMPEIGRWTAMDPVSESYFSFSPYNYVRNNPILRVDPNGNWDITVHVYNDRSKYGYGTAEVTDRHGNVVHTFLVRVEGTAGRNRMNTNADTPLGVYDIPDENMWISGGSRKSYGPNPRLKLVGESGEIIDSGRDLIRVHGGRQEVYDKQAKKWVSVEDAELKKTHGCMRCYDADIKTLKEITDALEANDENEVGGKLTIVDDIFEQDGEYYHYSVGNESEDTESSEDHSSFWQGLRDAASRGLDAVQEWIDDNF